MKFSKALTTEEDGFDYAKQTARNEIYTRLRKTALKTIKEALSADISVEEKLDCIDAIRDFCEEGFGV